MADSIRALVDYWGKLTQAYGGNAVKAKPAMSLVEFNAGELDKVKSIEELVAKINESIASDC
jgi:hypothetical protein